MICCENVVRYANTFSGNGTLNTGICARKIKRRKYAQWMENVLFWVYAEIIILSINQMFTESISRCSVLSICFANCPYKFWSTLFCIINCYVNGHSSYVTLFLVTK